MIKEKKLIRKKRLVTIAMIMTILCSMIVIIPQSTLAASSEIQVSKTTGLTCGETIWVNVTDSSLTLHARYYVNVWGGSGWENIADKRADEKGNIAIKTNVPYRHPLGKYNLSLWNTVDDSGAQYGENVTIWIENTYKISYKVGDQFAKYALFNKTYEHPNAFKILIYNWTGSKYEILKKSVTITLYDPEGKQELSKVTSTGMWDIDYTFNYNDDGNLETYYWANVTRSTTNEYSNATLPVKLDVTATLPTSAKWGDEITITGYVKGGKGKGIKGYTVKLYSPSLNGYGEMDSAVTYSSGRYTLATPTNVDGGSAGTWYVGTEMAGLYRIDETDKLNIPNFIQYHKLDVASDDSALVNIVSPDEIVSGFTQTVNVSVKWRDKAFEDAWIHVTGLKATYNDIDYKKDDIIVVGNGQADHVKGKYAYYEFQIKFTETGTARILITSPMNNTVYEEYDDLEANITGSTTFTVVPSDDMIIIVENMPEQVMITETGNCWQNAPQTITIKVYGKDEDKRMNASIRITGCELDISIDEDDAVDDGYWQADGEYKIDISPKTAGTITITATNSTKDKTVSKDFKIKGLSGTVSTSNGDDLEVSVQSTETVTATITNGQYAQVHLTYFDENWVLIDCINYTNGDDTAGNGLNGRFEFILTEDDIKEGIGYIVVAAKAGSNLYLYEIIEVVPVHDLVIDIIEPEESLNYILTVGLKQNLELKVLDKNGDVVDDVDSVIGEMLDKEGDVIQKVSFNGPTVAETWYLDDWVPHFAGMFVITAKNNTGGNEHDGNTTLNVGLARITFTPDKVTAGIELTNIAINITAVDANSTPLPKGTKLYINIDNADGTETYPDEGESFTLAEDGTGSFIITQVGDNKGKITLTLQDTYNPDYMGNVTEGELLTAFPTFDVDPSEIFINMANTVTITAYDCNDNPIEGIYLTFLPSVAGIIPAQPTPLQTDADGKVTFSVSPQATGKLNITIARDLKYIGDQLTWTNAVVTDTDITVTSAKQLKIELSKSPIYQGETLTITVKSGTTPISGVLIQFGEDTTTTNAEGKATFIALDPGVDSTIYTITAEKAGYISAEKSIIVIKKYPITIIGPSDDLTAGSSFTVTIVAKGHALAGAMVTFEGQTAISDANGKVVLTAPSKNGKYTVIATFEGYQDGTLDVTVGKAGDIPGFELTILLAAIGVASLTFLFRRRRQR